jgi:hypothetical protein
VPNSPRTLRPPRPPYRSQRPSRVEVRPPCENSRRRQSCHSLWPTLADDHRAPDHRSTPRLMIMISSEKPASDAPCSGLTQPRYRAWKPSTPTSPTDSKRPRTKDGSARSPQSRPPWPPPHRSCKSCAAQRPVAPPPCTSACPTSAARPGDPVRTVEAPYVQRGGSRERRPNALNAP